MADRNENMWHWPWPSSGWNFGLDYAHYSQTPLDTANVYDPEPRPKSLTSPALNPMCHLQKVRDNYVAVYIVVNLISQEMYTYWVKIINLAKKTVFVMRDLHRFRGRFESLTSMKVKIMEEFKELIPEKLDFLVGYFIGKQSTKYWIMCEEDLNAMYKLLGQDGKGNVLLWCDGRFIQQDSEI